MAGYIKLNREILGTWIHKEPKYLKAWIDIQMAVNWEVKTVYIGNIQHSCGINESLMSLDSWVNLFNQNINPKTERWTKSQVRRFFERLANEHKIETQSETQTTRLKLLFIDCSEQNGNANDTQTDTQKERKPTPTKEIRNKNKEIEYPAIFSTSIIERFEAFLVMRKEIRKPLTLVQAKINSLAKDIEKYGDIEVLEAIQKSIENQYQGIFPKVSKQPKEQPQPKEEIHNLEAYILQYYREVDLKHMKLDGSFDRWNSQLTAI